MVNSQSESWKSLCYILNIMYEHHVIFEGFVVELLRILVFNFSKNNEAISFQARLDQGIENAGYTEG
jgi:hypothetical protein